MKRIYQSGGVVSYTPFIPNSGTASTSSSGSTEKQDKITGTLQKEIVDVLKENGIQSDVDTFLSQANAFLNKSQHLSSMSLFGGQSDDYSMTDLIQVLSMANRVKQNKAYYDTAADRLKEQDAWNEVAVSTDGKIYVYSEEGLRTVSADEFHKNRDKYQALTNSQVLGLREQDSNMAFNSNVLRDMSGALGLKTITTQLMDTVSKFGTMSRTEYTKNTGNAISQSAWDGMQILLGDGPQGYYKATTKSERENVQNALRYLWSSLGTDGQARLRAETAANGLDPSRNHYDLLLQTIEHHTDFEQSVDFDKTATEYDPDGDGEGNASSSALGEIPYLVRIGRGDGQYELVNISMRTDTVMNSGSMNAWAANMGSMIDKNGNTLGMDSLTNVLAKAEAVKATRSKDITFGGQLLNDVEKNFVVYDGVSQLTDIWLPYKNVGGKITPDFDKLQKYNDFNDWVSKNPNLSKVEKLNEAYKRGLDSNEMDYDPNSGMFMFKQSKMKLFLSFSAYADNDNIDFTKLTEDLTEEMPNEFGKKYKDVFNNLFEYGKTHRQKSDKKVGLSFDTVRRWDIRKGNVFIPIDSDFLAMHMSMTEYAPKSDMNQFAARSTLAQQMAAAQNNNVSTLGQFR